MAFSFSGKLLFISVVALTSVSFSVHALSKESKKNARQAVHVYTLIADRYMPFIELYYQKEQAPHREQEFYARQLVGALRNAVTQEKLVLYGNWLSQAWRSLSSCSSEYPLVQFDKKYLEDALGHAQKQYKQLLNADFHSEQLRTLVQDLLKLRECVRQQPEYQLEECSIECDALKTQLKGLKVQVAEQKERISQLEVRTARGY